MATQQSKGALAGFLPEVSPEAAEANRRYIEAQRKLAETLDVRKNRTFDPMWLAAAKGFLAPTGSGSAFEAFGRVAENLGAAQEKEQELAKSIASQELELASAGLGMERMRQRDRAFQQRLGLGDPNRTTLATGPEGALPTAPTSGAALPPSVVRKPTAPAAGGALPAAQSQARGALPSPLQGMQGEQVAPGNPNFMTGDDYLAAAYSEGNVDLATATKTAADLERTRFDVKEAGVFDRSTGFFYRFPQDQKEVEIAYSGRSIKMPSQDAFKLDNALVNEDWPTYWRIAKKYGVNRPENAPGGAEPTPGEDLPGRAPAAGAPASGAPAASAQSMFRSTSEREARREADTAYAKKMAEGSAEMELGVPQQREDALQMRSITRRAQKLIDAAGGAVGIFADPTIGDAIGILVSEGIKLGPNAQISMPSVREAMARANPNITPTQLNSRVALMTELANIELLFRRIYLKGQGAVSNMEGEVVARLGGTVEMNADVLRDKMKYLQARAQFDLDSTAAWLKAKKNDPKLMYIDWKNSDEYIELADKLDQKLTDLFAESPLLRDLSTPAAKPPAAKPAATPAAPTAPRSAPSGAAAPAAPRAAPPANDFASSIKKKADELRRGAPQ
jgi:hypothetical protein